MIAGLLEGAMGAALMSVLGGIGLWVRHRRLDAAQVDDTDASAAERRANARKTDAEAWAITRTGLVEDVERLTTEVGELRQENRDQARVMASLTAQHRAALAHIVAVHEWDAGGRVGPMPTAPVDLALTENH